MQDFNGRKALQLQTRVQRAQGLEHLEVITKWQRRMQAANDVQFGNPQVQRLTRFLDDLLDCKLKPIRIPLFSRERTELAAQDAIIGVIDVTVNDVAGLISALSQPRPPRKIGDG